ncbi:MAG TPA: hypothetical protein VM033_03395 [Gemmatimonadaceae bacterium]|nr:hypothetical protein [Gemmatimonadaceae bacterium]
MKALLYTVVALLVTLPAAAQVGHKPADSPYADLEHKQEITWLFGYLRARHDPAGVAPRSAPMVGLRYELNLVGPLALSADLTRSFSNRQALDPARPSATRGLGTRSAPVTSADLALALDLTGRKSWHRLVPQVRAGLGVVSGRAKDDSSGFSFGTPFAFSFGGGLKFVPGGRVQLRMDVTERVFKLSYPDSYYRKASDNTSVLAESTPRSFYTHHAALTVGVSYLFGR